MGALGGECQRGLLDATCNCGRNNSSHDVSALMPARVGKEPVKKASGSRAIKWQVLWRGLRWRFGSAAMLFVVATLAIAGAAIGPMFLQSADSSVLSGVLASAPREKRTSCSRTAVRAARPGQRRRCVRRRREDCRPRSARKADPHDRPRPHSHGEQGTALRRRSDRSDRDLSSLAPRRRTLPDRRAPGRCEQAFCRSHPSDDR